MPSDIRGLGEQAATLSDCKGRASSGEMRLGIGKCFESAASGPLTVMSSAFRNMLIESSWFVI